MCSRYRYKYSATMLDFLMTQRTGRVFLCMCNLLANLKQESQSLCIYESKLVTTHIYG